MSEIDQKDRSPSINVPVDWHIPEGYPRPYASNMFAQAGEYEIILSFFQANLPLLTGTPEENKAKLEQIESISAECVSRVIVNPELVPKIIKALQTTYDAYTAVKLSERSKEE
jgi:hypothetical protein